MKDKQPNRIAQKYLFPIIVAGGLLTPGCANSAETKEVKMVNCASYPKTAFEDFSLLTGEKLEIAANTITATKPGSISIKPIGYTSTGEISYNGMQNKVELVSLTTKAMYTMRPEATVISGTNGTILHVTASCPTK